MITFMGPNLQCLSKPFINKFLEFSFELSILQSLSYCSLSLIALSLNVIHSIIVEEENGWQLTDLADIMADLHM